jgi:hypothetical protein
MHFSKTLQYAVSGVLAVYIVFFTRPAPQAVVRLLSSSIAQLAALAVIVYVGASVSLLVALVAAVALVLSIPAREYLDAQIPDGMKDAAKDMAKAALSAGAAAGADKLENVAEANKPEKKDDKKPAAMSAEHPVGKPSDGKEHFDGAPF